MVPDRAFVRRLLGTYTPRGWRVRQEAKRMADQSGLADSGTRILYVPRLDTDHPDFTGLALTFLHEAGHVHLGHFEASLLPHIEEFEAERFALLSAHAVGLRIGMAHLATAATRVRDALEGDRASGRAVHAGIQRWVETPHHGLLIAART